MYKVFIFPHRTSGIRRVQHARLASLEAAVIEAEELAKQGLIAVVEDETGARVDDQREPEANSI